MVEVEGNTISSPRAGETAQKTIKKVGIACKRISAGKQWCFTHNNWCEQQLVEMVEMFSKFDMEYVIGEEVGDEGTPHLQGAVFAKHVFRPMEKLGLTFKPHWEKCKGTREQNITYCTKQGGTVHSNIKMPEQLYCPEIYGWQLQVAEIVEVDPLPSDRTIHWFWEPTGNVGKSDLMRWLVIKKGAVVCAGKAADMKHLIVTYTEKNNGVWPKIIVIDVPRVMQGYLSWSGLEEVKNGIFASSKYESQMFCMNRPHMIVLANFAPEPGREMSADRFNIVRIGEEYTPCETHGRMMIGRDVAGEPIWQ